MRKNAETIISRMAVEVDRDVHPELAEQLSDFSVTATAHIVKMIEGLDETCAHWALVIGPEGNAEHLEPRPIVLLEELGDQIGDRVLTKIRREVGNPWFAVASSLRPFNVGGQIFHFMFQKSARTLQLERRIFKKAEIAHLDGRRPMRENPETRILGVALEINDDVDLELVQELRYLEVVTATHIMKMVESLGETSSHLAPVIRTEGNAEELETLPVLPLEELGYRIGGRMPMKIRGEISDARFARAAPSSSVNWRRQLWDLIFQVGLGTAKLQCWFVTISDEHKRVDDRRLIDDVLF